MLCTNVVSTKFGSNLEVTDFICFKNDEMQPSRKFGDSKMVVNTFVPYALQAIFSACVESTGNASQFEVLCPNFISPNTLFLAFVPFFSTF